MEEGNKPAVEALDLLLLLLLYALCNFHVEGHEEALIDQHNGDAGSAGPTCAARVVAESVSTGTSAKAPREATVAGAGRDAAANRPRPPGQDAAESWVITISLSGCTGPGFADSAREPRQDNLQVMVTLCWWTRSQRKKKRTLTSPSLLAPFTNLGTWVCLPPHVERPYCHLYEPGKFHSHFSSLLG